MYTYTYLHIYICIYMHTYAYIYIHILYFRKTSSWHPVRIFFCLQFSNETIIFLDSKRPLEFWAPEALNMALLRVWHRHRCCQDIVTRIMGGSEAEPRARFGAMKKRGRPKRLFRGLYYPI